MSNDMVIQVAVEVKAGLAVCSRAAAWGALAICHPLVLRYA